MQFKKLAAIAGSALMAGMTLAGAALAATNVGTITNLAKPLDTTANFPLFVIGATAATADVAGAVDIAVRLAAESKTTEMVTTAAGEEETVTNGIQIKTSGNELVPWETIQDVKSILTASDLSILADGTFSMGAGSYGFKQYLYLQGETSPPAYNVYVDYRVPTGETTPRLSFTTPVNAYLYTYKLTFSTPVAISGAATTAATQDLLKGYTIKLLGKDFVISDVTCTGSGATADISDMTLLGGKNVEILDEDAPKTIIMEGKEYIVTVDKISAATGNIYYAVGNVNGESFSLKDGETTTLSDGTEFGVIKVFAPPVAGGIGSAKITIGAEKIKLFASATVQKKNQPVSGLTSIITAGTGTWSGITISYQPQNAQYKAIGESITDPFISAFDIKFNSFNPAFDDATKRQTILFTPSGRNMLLGYKNAAGNDQTVYTLYQDGTQWRWAAALDVATGSDNNHRDLVFDESQEISAIEGDYFVINYGGFSHVMSFTSMDPANSLLTFTDERGTAVNIYNTSATAATLIMDGNSYDVSIVNAAVDKKLIRIDLNKDGDISTTAGLDYSFLTPKLVTRGQGGLYFYGRNDDTLFTTANRTVTVTSGAAPAIANIGLIPLNISEAAGTITVKSDGTTVKTLTSPGDNLYVNDTFGSSDTGYIDFWINCLNTTGTNTYACNIGLGTSAATLQTKPGFVLVQEALEGGTTHNWVFVPVDYDTPTTKTYVSTPVSDDGNYVGISVIGATGQYKGMTTYGTLVEYLSLSAGGTGSISYPDTFSYANVYVLTPEGKVTTGAVAGEVTTEKVLAIKTDVVKLDTEVTAADKAAKDIIIVGGPCVNTLAATVLGKTFPACGAESGIPENAATIKVFKDAFATGKVAVLVAGWEAADTDLACRAIQADKLAAQTATEVTVKGTSLETLTFE